MDYEILASVIDSAKRIVAGKGTDEDWMDIGTWGAETIVALDRDFGNAEMHLRDLVNTMEHMTMANPLMPVDSVNAVWFKASQYLKSLEAE
mgnify:FL=1